MEIGNIQEEKSLIVVFTVGRLLCRSSEVQGPRQQHILRKRIRHSEIVCSKCSNNYYSCTKQERKLEQYVPTFILTANKL